MLMVTVTAFATSYTDKLTYKLTVLQTVTKELPAGELTVEPYGKSNYTVTAKGCDFSEFEADNWYEIVCEDVPGTTDANGVTTITLDNPYAFRTSDYAVFTNPKLVVKFNGTKAYAHFEGQIALYGVNRPFEYTFGTDDFESTGGGETTEKYTVNFDKGAKSTHSGRFLRSFSLQQTGKEKQTESVSALRAAYEDHTSKVFTVEAGSELTASFNYSGEWMNGYVYIDRDNDGEFSYTEGQWNQAGTDLVAYSFYTTLANPKVNDGNGYNSTGASVSGNDRSNVNPPSFTAPTEPGTYRIRFKIDWNCILPGGSSDILSDGGGVWDATLNVVAAEPTVKEEKSFTDAISMVVGDMSEVAGQAQVTIKEMTDETISMTLAVVGQEGAEYTASGFTKTVDTEKNRTTYTGTLNIEDEDYDVTALVYTDGVEKLYMVAKGAEYNYVIGTNPDAPKTPDPVDVVEEGFKATGESWKQEGVAIDWDTQYIAAKLDLSTCKISSGPENVLAVGTDITGWNDGPHYLFYYNKAAKVLQYNYLHSANKSYNRGFANLSKAYIQLTDEVVTIEISKQGGLKINGESALVKYVDTATNPSNNSTESWTTEDLPTVFSGLWALNTIDFGGCQGAVMSNAKYKYVKVAPLGWTEPTEPTEPEVTVTFEKQYADQLYSLADGTPSAMGDATVTLKEMSDNTISMSLAFIDMNVESTDLVKGTDEKDRITYTGTANFQGINYAVKALRYTKDEEEKLYMTLIPTEGTTLAFGTDPDYVAPEPPSIEGTVVEGSVDFAANGSKFEWSNIAIDWNKQKLVAVIDLSTCVGTNEDILSVGQNISAWQIGGWHFYYTKSENRMKSDYLTTGGAHPISDANTPVEPGIVRIELSKAEGCTIDGVSFNGFYDSSVTGTWQSNTEDFWNLTSVNIGSKEGNGRSNAVIKYVTVVDIESTEPETPKAVVYKNTLKIVRGTDTKEYTDAEVSVLAKGEGKYEVVLPEFSDMDSAEGTIPGTIGKLTFVADGVEADGKLKLTASSVETTQEGGEGWESQTFTASMDATVENDQLAGTFTVVVDGYETMYTYNLYYGVEAPEVVTEVSNDNYTSNLRILDGETTVVEEAEANVNIVKYSDESYKVTLKDVTLNENTQDLVFVGKALIEEAPTEATEPLTIIAKSDEATTAFFGEEMNGTFELTEVSADEIKMEFAIEGEGVLYEGEFNYEAKTPAAEPFCKENYVADGNGFEWEFAVDWDTQKVVMSIDPSTCTGNCEDVIGLGAVPTAWVNTLHLYRTRDQKLQGYFQVPGGNNNNTDKFAETVPFLVEVSKAQGFVVNDVVKIPASAMSYLFTLPTVKMGTGEGANDKSRATYNYVKVVDKDWTKDPETGINATTVAEGEFEVFSVDGVKLSKLQKGLNIVRSADGKVKKVLVK